MPDDLDPPALDPAALEPLYQQLAAILRHKILTGEIGGAVPVPSMRSLCETYGISSRTVYSAIDVLRAEELVETHTGRGLYATKEDQWPAHLRRPRE